MTRIAQHYQDIRHLMQPGDVIAFGGESPFSELIKFSTRSAVSHVAVVFQSQMLGENSSRFFNQVIESASFNDKSGVMLNRLSDRLASYEGNIWWLPLNSQARQAVDENKKAFFNFLLNQQHKPYDLPQALMSAVDSSRAWLNNLCLNDEDFSAFFCSELVAAALEIARVLPDINASEVTPIDLCRLNLYQKNYIQIKGQEKRISGYNQMSVTGWQA